MVARSPTFTELPLDIVGSSVFGRYPKISSQRTYNMIISDGWAVPYAGYKKVSTILPEGIGRGIYSSDRYNHMIMVIDNNVYTCNTGNGIAKIAEIETSDGDVFIDENNAGQIGICDKKNIYAFNYKDNTFHTASLDAGFLPGYIAFQDGYGIAPNLNSPEWRLSDPNNFLNWPADPQNVGEFQTKPDSPLAAIRVPGKGKLLFVFGKTIVEPWYDVGGQIFPYDISTFFNIDFGCLNPATIAWNDTMVVWLGGNEKSGPVIMFSDGTEPQQISTDGINYEFASLTNPENSYGFLFKQDGHLIYQVSFPSDNLSYIYDFNTQKFFNVCDENMGCHIAKRVVFFNNSYYFVSFKDGNLYEMNSKYTAYDGKEIPRVRVTQNIRTPDSMPRIFNNVTFPIEQGQNHSVSRVDMSVSVDGGESFSSYDSMQLNSLGNRQGQLIYWNLGYANDMVFQFRFWGKGRFVAANGVVNIYQ